MDYNAQDPKFRQSLIGIGDDILKSTIQFFVKEDELNYKPYGTGVLYSNAFQYFIITAAHVTDKQLFVVSGNELMALTGIKKIINSNSKNIDLCYIIIDTRMLSFLKKNYHSISKENVYLSHTPTQTLNYLVVGFPANTQKLNLEGRLNRVSLRYYNLKMSKENVYDYCKIDKTVQYALDFKGKMENYENSEIKKIGEPFGLSGSGLWMLVQKEKDVMYSLGYKLIGIMTEFRKGRYHCLIGNKIEFISKKLEDIGGPVFYLDDK